MDEEGDNLLLEDNYYQLLNVSKTVIMNHVHFLYPFSILQYQYYITTEIKSLIV